jgi:hypothetical protein
MSKTVSTKFHSWMLTWRFVKLTSKSYLFLSFVSFHISVLVHSFLSPFSVSSSRSLHSAFSSFLFFFFCPFVSLYLVQLHRSRFWISVEEQQTTQHTVSVDQVQAMHTTCYVQLKLLPYDFKEMNGDIGNGLHPRTGAVFNKSAFM